MDEKKIRGFVGDLRNVIADVEMHGYGAVDFRMPVGYLKAVVEALEKQLPKKVEQRRDYRDFNNQHVRYTGFCPNCKMTVTSNRNRTCHKCGQALDWSE